MKGLNRVILVGNLGKDPEFKELNDGLAVAKIMLATTEIFRSRTGDLQADTQWHTIILWRSLAELARMYLKKGSLVYVEGKVRSRSYLAKEGEKRYVSEIIANSFIMLDKKPVPATIGNSEFADGLFDEPLPF